jgi:hypothetical protein
VIGLPQQVSINKVNLYIFLFIYKIGYPGSLAAKRDLNLDLLAVVSNQLADPGSGLKLRKNPPL